MKNYNTKEINLHYKKGKILNKPTNRNDVIELSKWLDNMLEQLNNDNFYKENIDFFEYIQLIYTACLQELIRQVTIQCSERGNLFNKIWKTFIKILEFALFRQIKIHNNEEKSTLEEIERGFTLFICIF